MKQSSIPDGLVFILTLLPVLAMTLFMVFLIAPDQLVLLELGTELLRISLDSEKLIVQFLWFFTY